MTKDVLVSIKGLQFNLLEEEDHVETVTAAEYYQRDNSHYVIYDELFEGFEGSARNIIKFREHSLDLTKKGLISVHMVFEENRKNMTNYSTPFGSILIGIDAKRIRLEEAEEEIRVDVDYALEVNYEHLADCKLSMKIHSRKEELSLH